ncbi:MAG: SDR family oxidoreductase [Chitinophagales bacterium]|nr:SDR family oxidoreductase [Chitinophagales bacterium]
MNINTVLILGAKSDIAQALAYKFAENGYALLLAARKVQELEPVQKDIQLKYEVEVFLYEFDALDYKSHAIFYQSLAQKPSVAICVFGYLGNQEKALENWHEAEQIIDVNYKGAVSILNVIANDFKVRKEGNIIGISSVAGVRGRKKNGIYGSAKAAFTTYLSGLRNAMYAYNVHVLTVLPGFVYTKMTEGEPLPAPITAKPEQVASAIFKAYKKGKNLIYTLSLWRYIMLIIKMIPEPIFKKLNI